MAKRGRPTNYKPEYCEEIIKFFDIEATREVILPHYKNGEISWEDKKILANSLPTIEGFCAKLGIWKKVLHDWVKKHKEFGDAYKRAKELQAQIWQENSLLGLYNPQFSIFFGKNCMGWKDKQEHQIEGELKFNVVNFGDNSNDDNNSV